MATIWSLSQQGSRHPLVCDFYCCIYGNHFGWVEMGCLPEYMFYLREPFLKVPLGGEWVPSRVYYCKLAGRAPLFLCGRHLVLELLTLLTAKASHYRAVGGSLRAVMVQQLTSACFAHGAEH